MQLLLIVSIAPNQKQSCKLYWSYKLDANHKSFPHHGRLFFFFLHCNVDWEQWFLQQQISIKMNKILHVAHNVLERALRQIYQDELKRNYRTKKENWKILLLNERSPTYKLRDWKRLQCFNWLYVLEWRLIGVNIMN